MFFFAHHYELGRITLADPRVFPRCRHYLRRRHARVEEIVVALDCSHTATAAYRSCAAVSMRLVPRTRAVARFCRLKRAGFESPLTGC